MIFKRKSKLALMVCVIFSCVFIIVASAAGAGQPGSDADPLVTKSYVDQKLAQISSQLGGSGTSGTIGTVDSGTIAMLQTDVGDLTAFIIQAFNEIETLKNKVAGLESGYAVVPVKAGQKVLLAGGSEAILRNGTATVIQGTYGGLVDASAGKDLTDKVSVPAQHLLISSRTDGRGILVKTDANLLIRGAYTVQ